MPTILTWFPVALAAIVIVNFVVQLAIGRSKGFVTRTMMVLGVSVVLLGVATAVFAIVDVAG